MRGDTLELRLDDPAGGGYPGNLEVVVRYRLRGRALTLIWEACSDADTLCNLTTHAYWNLAGQGAGSALGHFMQIRAGRMAELDDEALPTGRVLETAGTAHDFRRWRCLRDPAGRERALPPSGCYLPDNPVNGPAAQLWEPERGRLMRLYTDQPALHYYSGYLVPAQLSGKRGAAYGPHCGVCLEPQAVSDGLNRAGLPSPLLRRGERYRRYVRCEFDHSAVPPWERRDAYRGEGQ